MREAGEIQEVKTSAGVPRTGTAWRSAALVLGACGVFVLNNLGLVSARLQPAPGTVAMHGFRATDLALYETWMRLFQHSVLIPNFTVPEATEPGFFNLLMFFIGRLSGLVHLEPSMASLAVQAALYVAAAFGLYLGFRIFLRDAAQRWLAAALAVCAVPVPSLAVLPALLTGYTWPLPGIGYFVWITSDGLYHGIAGSVLVTFGTAATLIAFSAMGAYLREGNRRWLAAACLAVFAAGAIHANEALLVSGSVFLAFVLRPPRARAQALKDALLVGTSGALGLLLLVIPALQHPWVKQIGRHSAGTPLSPLDVAVSIGLPALLCLALLPFSRPFRTTEDALLTFWLLLSITGSMLPLLPTPQHFLDGLHYGSAILLTRLLAQKPAIEWVNGHRRLAAAALTACCVLSFSAYLSYCRQGYLDGRLPAPRRLFSAVQPRDEADMIEWLRKNADPGATALAPAENAAWVGAIPLRTIGAHWLWSMDSPAPKMAAAFYRGELNCRDAEAFLNRNRVRYVVVNERATVQACLPGGGMRARFGTLVVYEAAPGKAEPWLPEAQAALSR